MAARASLQSRLPGLPRCPSLLAWLPDTRQHAGRPCQARSPGELAPRCRGALARQPGAPWGGSAVLTVGWSGATAWVGPGSEAGSPDGAPVHIPGLEGVLGPDQPRIGYPLQVAKPTAARSSRRSTVVRLGPAARPPRATPTVPCRDAAGLVLLDQQPSLSTPASLLSRRVANHAVVCVAMQAVRAQRDLWFPGAPCCLPAAFAPPLRCCLGPRCRAVAAAVAHRWPAMRSIRLLARGPASCTAAGAWGLILVTPGGPIDVTHRSRPNCWWKPLGSDRTAGCCD